MKLNRCPKEVVTDAQSQQNVLNGHKTHGLKQKTTLLSDIYTGKWMPLNIRMNVQRFISRCNRFPLYTSPYVEHCRQITATVLFYHNVNKTCPLISSNIVIRGPGWTCYSTNICRAMHHLRPCHSLYESHNSLLYHLQMSITIFPPDIYQ